MLITNFGTIPSQGGLMLPNWSYGKEITIPANSIDADLTNFPCTVILNSTNFDFSKAKSDGSDIRFTDKLFNHYKFEKIEYSNINQFAKFTVLIPSVSDLTDTKFYVWAGNSNAYNTSIEAWQDMTGKQLTYNGNVKLVPNVAKFGKCAYFDGSGDYLSIPSSTDFDFGTGEFTVDFWMQTINQTERWIFDTRASNVVLGQWMCVLANGTIQYGVDNGTSWGYLYSTLKVTDGKLHHIEISKANNVIKLFIDGNVEATLSHTVTIDNATEIVIGNCNAGVRTATTGYVGYLDEFRLSNIARHTSNFTPPQEPYTVDANTKLLLHFDTAPFTDETGKTVTTYGDVKPIKTAYADGARGAYFDGSGDYFGLDGSSNFAYGTGDFEIEIKYVPNANGTLQMIYDSRPVGGNGLYPCIYRTSANKIAYHINATDVILSTLTTAVGTEYDIVLSRVSGVTRLRINGTQEGSNYTDTNNYLNYSTGSPRIGEGLNATGYGMNGYLFGMRITKGRARNTGIVPTKFEVDGSDVVFCTNFDTIYSQDYAMVQHMGDSLVDATGNGNNGTATGTTVVSTDYGKVRQFDGTDDKITTALFTNTDNVTLTIMATKVGTGGTDLLFYVGTSGTNGYGLYTNSLKFSLKAGSTFADTTVSNTTTPQVVTLTRTNGTWTAIIDGISYAVTNLSVTTPTGLTYFGGSTTDFYDGQLSNARYSTVARSTAYTKAEQKALKNTLLTITGA